MSLQCGTPYESFGEDFVAEFGVDQLPVFPAWVPPAVLPHHDDGRAGYMNQVGEFGLRVTVAVPPIFESLLAGRLRSDETVVDWRMPAVVADGVEESRVGVLTCQDFLAVDGDREWVRCHGGFISFRLVSWRQGFPV